MRAKKALASFLRPGDHVQWAPGPGDELPNQGVILEVRPNPSASVELDECLIEVTPTIIGIFQASQLTRVETAHPEEEFFEMLVP